MIDMKKIVMLLSAVMMFTACSEDDKAEQLQMEDPTTEVANKRGCATDEVFQAQLAADPALADEVKAEAAKEAASATAKPVAKTTRKAPAKAAKTSADGGEA